MAKSQIPLFVYAQLEGKGYPKAAVPGTLRRRGDDGAAQFKANSGSLVHGELRTDEEQDYDKLDKFEAPQYARVRVKTTDGTTVYAYEYVEDNFTDLPLISSGRF